jgi:hypothetical protein
MGNGVLDGFSHDELLNIGTRKAGLNLNMSATDINRSSTFAESQAQIAQMEGLSEALSASFFRSASLLTIIDHCHRMIMRPG